MLGGSSEGGVRERRGRAPSLPPVRGVTVSRPEVGARPRRVWLRVTAARGEEEEEEEEEEDG